MNASTHSARRVLLGITGGIAAYKSAIVVRRLRDAGHEVQVVMTPAAEAFIAPLTLHSLSGRSVRRSLLDEAAEAAMGHIELARWADIVLVAPASADFIARLAHGLADDLLSTLCLATPSPLCVAPAMNQQMWAAAATQANVDVLRARGVRVLGPASGDQACGDVGPGRMLEPEALVEQLFGDAARPLAGQRVVVTAGPTREALDPVRFLSNRSSGRMGFAVAAAAEAAGATVTLVTGPCALATPPGVARIDVESAADMLAAVCAQRARCDVFIAAAAVADYRAAQIAPQKMKKSADDEAGLRLELIRNPDILATMAAGEPRPFCVGFAAETRDVERYARDKLERKRLDMIAANDVSRAEQGFDVDANALEVFWPGGQRSIALGPKRAVAAELVALIAERCLAQDKPAAA